MLFSKKDSVNLLEDIDALVGPESTDLVPEPPENKHAPKIARKGFLKEERIKRLYMRQLEGLPAKQLVFDHAKKENISRETAWRDWRAVSKLNDEDFSVERETMAARIFSMRQKVLNSAVRKGQLQTAAQLLDSLARQVGCDEAVVNSSLPEIRVKIQKPEE